MRIGWPGWLRTDLAGWWLTGLGLVPLFVVSGTLVLGGLGVATGVTDADAAWTEVPLAILFGVYATPVFGILAAVYCWPSGSPCATGEANARGAGRLPSARS